MTGAEDTTNLNAMAAAAVGEAAAQLVALEDELERVNGVCAEREQRLAAALRERNAARKRVAALEQLEACVDNAIARARMDRSQAYVVVPTSVWDAIVEARTPSTATEAAAHA